jgi:hypothetical protein
MVRYNLFLLFIASLVVLPQVGAQDTSEAPDPPSFEAKYKLILERNIFSRARQVYREVVKVPRNEPPPPPLEASFVVVGISRQNDMTVAFIEDTSLGQVDQYAVNSQIARGKIQAMTLDSLQYVVSSDVNDVNAVAVTDVKVGQSLLGETASGERRDSRRTYSRRPAESNDETKPAQDSRADELSDEDAAAVLKRMMEKRNSE